MVVPVEVGLKIMKYIEAGMTVEEATAQVGKDAKK